ncbi:energy transducer TonB [Paracoccus seriniphilus]|uniref:TonB family C-terminal domain-containing protein n=1 Tax=Paracoccus seriniphilus TaxID=184748 RepID=A0A239PLB5_9RHOB|nr:energy transducer TonB [Paracoccus seriniphilus]WCR13788.1 TonB family protein [Paracoccus seriniphilus]SNT68598.1 TonB family C-terminal domain-containing protein [Paracoccus seriniphilus]
MPSRRVIETAAFFVIAAALHVSAAALILPEQVKRGAPQDAPPAALAAGSTDMQELVAQWDAPPALDPEPVQPEQIQPPVDETADVTPQPMPQPEPPAMTQPDPLPQPEAVARPNLPPPPEAPRVEIARENLPELRSFEPPEIKAEPALTLSASARPERRPAKPEPKRQVARKQPAKPRAQPQKRTTAQKQQQSAAASRAGQGGQAKATRSGGGGGGMSAKQRASLQAQWQAQISSCLLRSIARTSGGSGLRATLSIRMGRNGRVQAAQISGSSGNARVDREITRGAKRARCPAAPKALTKASYSFIQPISIR